MSLTELSVAALVARATGTKSNPARLGVVAAAAGRLGRALALADVAPTGSPELADLKPSLFHEVGRSLVYAGESVFLIEVRGGRVRLMPVSHWDVAGTARRWRYRCDLSGPSGFEQVTVSADQVVHIRINADAREPWRGRGMLELSDASGNLAAALEESLGSEANAGVRLLVPAPSEGQGGGASSDDEDEQEDGADGLDTLKADLLDAEGSVTLVPSMGAGWGDGRGSSPGGDWRQVRIGAAPPRAAVSLRRDAEDSLLAGLAIPPDLVRGGGEGAANREALRQYFHGAVLAFGAILQEEIQAKLNPDCVLTFGRLGAADVMGRSRAFQSMTAKDDNLSSEEAAKIAGLR